MKLFLAFLAGIAWSAFSVGVGILLAWLCGGELFSSSIGLAVVFSSVVGLIGLTGIVAVLLED